MGNSISVAMLQWDSDIDVVLPLDSQARQPPQLPTPPLEIYI